MDAEPSNQTRTGWLCARRWFMRAMLILAGVTFLVVLATEVPTGWFWFAFFGIPILVVVILWWHEERTIRRVVVETLRGRLPMTDAEFSNRFYEQTMAPVAARLRRLLADNLECDLSGMIPADDFAAWLELFPGPDSAADCFFEDIAVEFQLDQSCPWPERFESFDALVRFVGMHGSAKPHR